MELQASDSKKLFKVFDASKRKKGRKRRDGVEESNSLVTDDSNSLSQAKTLSLKSAKASLQDLTPGQGDGPGSRTPTKRDRDSSPSVSPSPGGVEGRRNTRSPRRHRHSQRDGISLALKAGLVSTPRSGSPLQNHDGLIEGLPRDQDSFIYKYLEEAIKRDKRKHRHHSRRHEERRSSRDHDRERDHDFETSTARDHHHHHRHRHDEIPSHDRDKPVKEQPLNAAIDQALLIETFAKLCSTITEKNATNATVHPPVVNEIIRSQSHKSLQCEVVSQPVYDVDQHPVRLRSREPSHNTIAPCRSRVRSHENLHDSRARLVSPQRYDDKFYHKLHPEPSRMRNDDDRNRDANYHAYPARSCTDHFRDKREYRDYDDRRDPRRYEDDKRRFCEQKTSRSFNVHRDVYPEDDRLRRTTRSDSHNKKRCDPRYDDRRYDDRRERYVEVKDRSRERHIANLPSKDRRSRRNLERFERTSVMSREDFRERDRYSERERDSGLSVVDGDTSTVSGKSNYLRVVKQEIAEQREAMDKMMKLWKELMRCFKGLSQNQGQEKAVQDSAANVQESAAAQLRLWRECMRRYETVARDVGDTDARLMEEISKQRNEMAEMANMWQECLQRYRDMSNDFDNLKRQVPPAGYVGSPLRGRASEPPAWWWRDPPPRRRSSPESRASRSRERRHRRKDRDEPRYNKEKTPSKTTHGRSDHRHRKR